MGTVEGLDYEGSRTGDVELEPLDSRKGGGRGVTGYLYHHHNYLLRTSHLIVIEEFVLEIIVWGI